MAHLKWMWMAVEMMGKYAICMNPFSENFYSIYLALYKLHMQFVDFCFGTSLFSCNLLCLPNNQIGKYPVVFSSGRHLFIYKIYMLQNSKTIWFISHTVRSIPTVSISSGWWIILPYWYWYYSYWMDYARNLRRVMKYENTLFVT